MRLSIQSFTKLCVLIVLLLFVVPLLHGGRTHAQTGGTFNLLGHFGGVTNAVFVDGNTAYIGTGSSLIIFDVSNSTNPVILGKSDPMQSYGISDMIQNIDVVDGVAYMANRSHGLITVDVSDPTNPVFLNSIDIGSVADVVVVGNIAYVGDGNK